MDKLKEIQTNRNDENKKHSKGIWRIIAGILLTAASIFLIAVGPSIAPIVAIDSFASGIVGGVVSPVILGFVGLFGVAKTISGTLKASKAKKNIKALDMEETQELERVSQENIALEEQNRALRDENIRDDEEHIKALAEIKDAIQAASQPEISQTSALTDQAVINPVNEEHKNHTLEL